MLWYSSGAHQAKSSHPELSSQPEASAGERSCPQTPIILSPLRNRVGTLLQGALVLSKYHQKLCWWPHPTSAKLLLYSSEAGATLGWTQKEIQMNDLARVTM